MIKAFLILLLAVPAWAQVAVPPLKGRVADLTGTLKREQIASLEQMLRSFEERKGSQIAVLMLRTTAPETIEQYALRVAEQWQVGRKKVDDGVVLVIAKDDRTVRIEVGYGLEGVLNDATASRIIREVIVPRFREGDFYGGISAAVDRMIRVIDGEPLPEPRPGPQVEGGTLQMLPVLFILALVGGAILRRALGRVFGSLATGGAVGIVAWLLVGTLAIALIAAVLAILFTLVGGLGTGRRYYGGLPGGYGGWGGGGFGGGGSGGGGGFSGGGGSFGGGAVGIVAWLLVGTLAIALIAAVVAFLFTLAGGLGTGRRYYGGLPGGYGGWGGGGFGGGGSGGGGGFSGGGGSFGGGGASGRW